MTRAEFEECVDLLEANQEFDECNDPLVKCDGQGAFGRARWAVKKLANNLGLEVINKVWHAVEEKKDK